VARVTSSLTATPDSSPFSDSQAKKKNQARKSGLNNVISISAHEKQNKQNQRGEQGHHL
jgi:hypothetical protein